MITNSMRRWCAGAAGTVALAFTATAQAAIVPLEAYNASAFDLDLSIDVTVSGGVASFEFANNSSGASAGAVLARIYFETGLAALGLSNPAIDNVSGVLFSTSYPGPASPPGGNLVSWSGELYAIGAVVAPPFTGLGVGDVLRVTFDYGGSLATLVAALTDAQGNARIAGHVLDCVNDDSCTAVTTSVIPLPAPLLLMLSALAGLGFVRRRS